MRCNLCSIPLCTLIQISLVSSAVSPNICEEYEKVEKKLQCGSNGYPLNYGLRNCRIFTNKSTLEKFSQKGQQFVDCSTRCLVTAIQNISQYTSNCGQVQQEAFKSHVDCYLNCDFCQVCKTEKVALLRSYDWTDFLSFGAVQQVYSIVRKCGVFGCFARLALF